MPEKTRLGKIAPFDSNYESELGTRLQRRFHKWITEDPVVLSDEPQITVDLQIASGDTARSILAVTESADHSISLFFEYMPDTYNHPVTVLNKKAIIGLPTERDLNRLRIQAQDSTDPRIKVLLHDYGFYIACISIPSNIEGVEEFMQSNIAFLKKVGSENLNKKVNPTVSRRVLNNKYKI